MQVLLVEDDRSLADGLCKALAGEGFTVNHVARGADALHAVEVDPPDIVVLDLGLPDIDGLDVLRRLRRRDGGPPVLILTARASVEARVTGLDEGADDYLPKPFEIPELVARLRVIERRLCNLSSSVIRVGNVTLDTRSREVTCDGVSIALPRREYAVLKALMEHAGKVRTRDQLQSRLYAWGEEVASNALEVHVHHLRRKLGDEFIKTIRGVGYATRQP